MDVDRPVLPVLTDEPLDHVTVEELGVARIRPSR